MHKPVHTEKDTVDITVVNNLSEIVQLTENVTETYIEYKNVIQTYSNRFSLKNAVIIVTLFICTVVYIGKRSIHNRNHSMLCFFVCLTAASFDAMGSLS